MNGAGGNNKMSGVKSTTAEAGADRGQLLIGSIVIIIVMAASGK